ncbi:MAG: AsmA family protein [Aquabacterium sp.]
MATAPDNQHQTARHHRRWPWVVGGLLTPLVILGLCEWRGWPFLKNPLAEQLTTQLHHDVHFGDTFSLHLLTGLRLRTDRLDVKQPAWLTSTEQGQAMPAMVSADNLYIRVPYSTVWHVLRDRALTHASVRAIEVDRLDIDLSRDAQGRANWSLDETGIAPPQPPGSKPATLPRIDLLQVKAGSLKMRDKILRLDMDAQLSTAEGATNAHAAGLHVTGGGHYRGNPFDLLIASSGALPLLTDPKTAPPVPIVIHAKAGKAKLGFDGVSRDVLSLGSLDGQLDLSGPSMAALGDAVGITLPTTAMFSLKGRLSKDGDVWGLDMSALNVGSSRMSGQFTFDRQPAVPMLTGELRGSQFALYDLGPAFGAPTDGSPNPKPPSGLVLPQREFDVPSLRAMNADIKLRLQRVTLGNFFALPLEPLDADLRLQSGVLSITNLVASTADGRLGGDLSMDASKGKQLLWNANLQWSGIKLERWLNTPEAPVKPDPKAPATTKVAAKAAKSYVTGELDGKAKLHGEGNSTATLLGSMNGSVDTWVRHGQMSHLLVEAMSLHVAESLGLLLLGDTQQPLHCAATHLSAKNGVVQPDVAIIDTPHATILVSGNISLANEKLDLTLNSKPKFLSPISLRTPVDLGGTFAHPSVSLHANPLGLKLAGAALLAVVTPLAAIIPLVDVGGAPEDGCGPALQKLQAEAAAAK